MRILRLSESDDTAPGVADEQRAWYIAQQKFAAELGQPVETIIKTIWPTPKLPELIDRWLDELQPDLVFLKVNWYWYGYESVPLRVRRVLGPVGKPIAEGGLAAAKSQRLSKMRWFKAGRRWAHRTIGGDAPFEPGEIVDLMTVCIRRIIAHESTGLIVKGYGEGRASDPYLAMYYARFKKKQTFVEGSIERLCNELHVPFYVTPTAHTKQESGLDDTDGLHRNAHGHIIIGETEGDMLINGWRMLSGTEVSAARAT